MHNPPHPGEVLKEILEGCGIAHHEAAEKLGISPHNITQLLNGQSVISPEMAVRLSIALNTSSHIWIKLQSAFDLHEAEKSRHVISLQVKKILQMV